MELQEAQKQKKELEDNIGHMLDDFTNQTGLSIKYINIDVTRAIYGEPSRIANLSVEVYL